MKRIFIFSLVVLVIVVLLVTVGPTLVVKHDINDGYQIRLKPPMFIQPAYAHVNPEAFEIGQKLDDEAGISAYTQSPEVIDLSLARNAFTTIEIETADYLIGSVPIPNYTDHHDVHVYVHHDGWILAYYLNTDPVGKAIDVYAETLSSTKLYTAIALVAGAAGVSFTDVSYYNFHYPNATNMLFVAEGYENGNEFTITIPSSYSYFERSWGSNVYWGFTLDGVGLTPIYNDGTGYGEITAAQLLPGTPHVISVGDWAALVILYRVP